METWDVFHSDRLEVERSQTTEAVRAARARGDLRGDDLIRPAGTSDPWARLSDLPAPFGPDAPPDDVPPVFDEIPDDDEPETFEALIDEDEEDAEPVEEFDPQDEDEDAAEFTLSRNDPERVEELDLAAMVDVAFQLVLFFLVTATTVLYKSLEVPRPAPENAPAAAVQAPSRSLDDLMNEYILVEIDAAGAVKLDHEPVAPEMAALAARLRAARERTGRTTMLLSADFATPHRHAVLAYDAANEIGLGIAIARPRAPRK